MARGNYDTTIKEEVRKRGKTQRGSSRSEDAGYPQRDNAVRRMNVRRDQREGTRVPANLRQSTAYTPGEDEQRATRRARAGRDGGRDGGRGGGGDDTTTTKKKKKKPPVDPTNPTTGYPFAPPKHNPKGGDGGGGGDQPPGGGGGGGSAVPMDLLPYLLATAGITSTAGRARMRPSDQEIAQTLTRMGITPAYNPHVEDADIVQDPRLARPQEVPALPPPQTQPPMAPEERMQPGAQSPPALESPDKFGPPMEIITDDQLGDAVPTPQEKPRVRVQAPTRVVKPRIRVRVP